MEHYIKSNKWEVGISKGGKVGGNFDKIKRKELFWKEIQFRQITFLILPLNIKTSTIIASHNYDKHSNNYLNVACNNKMIRNMEIY